MNDKIALIAGVLFKHLTGEITKKESKILNKWIAESGQNKRMFDDLMNPDKLSEELKLLDYFHKIKFVDDDVTKYIDKDIGANIEPPKIIKDSKVINNTLFAMAQKDSNAIHKMSPREFESLIAELYEKAGYKVQLTPSTRDGGKDIILLTENKFIGKSLIYIECKKKDTGKPVGVSVVRQLYGTVISDNASGGIVIANTYFSSEAHNFEEKHKFKISLVNFSNLEKLIKSI